jgi:hypothetical protein
VDEAVYSIGAKIDDKLNERDSKGRPRFKSFDEAFSKKPQSPVEYWKNALKAKVYGPRKNTN